MRMEGAENNDMRVLLTYPEYPPTFFSFKHSLHLISRKAALPPLGLITVSALLPANWEKRLVDLNTAPLSADDLRWADYVFISAMHIQKDSVEIITTTTHRWIILYSMKQKLP